MRGRLRHRVTALALLLLLSVQLPVWASDEQVEPEAVWNEDDIELDIDQMLSDYTSDFHQFDLNSDGLVDALEVRASFEELHKEELYTFFRFADSDFDGT
eukprot:Cvel_29340.t1-p1 / transcript=Cvel_29340.t1 / gene=Cvel_29340 / organism=Chromera_velia_CCMP2878 / gene_product=hypothetical protein / transcript_product=hypothetical protein / location=Cvel_scaffold3991:11327-11756(+) / protein_length=99 / sequence_SO=supercontig / SO=protein_coding / is_pseudo=false